MDFTTANKKVMPTKVQNIELLIPLINCLSVKPNIRTAIAPTAIAKIPIFTFRIKARTIVTMNNTNASKSISIIVSIIIPPL